MAAEHFDADHIHTTPEGRHFRHGDGAEVDGEGNVIAEDAGQTLCDAIGYTIRRYAELRAYTFPTAARSLAAGCDNPAVTRLLEKFAEDFEAALAEMSE